MCGVTGTENVTPSAAAASTASLSGADRPVGDLPDACLLGSAASLITSFKRNFQRGHHHLQLTDIIRIRKRYQPVSLTADGRTASRSGGFFSPLFECGQLHERIGRCRENHSGSGPVLR